MKRAGLPLTAGAPHSLGGLENLQGLSAGDGVLQVEKATTTSGLTGQGT